jgi:hypothetical protein
MSSAVLVPVPDTSPAAVHHVAANMREWDRKEIFALRWDDDPRSVANDVLRVPGFSWVAFSGDVPAAVIGAAPAWPGVWSVFAFGTDDFSRVALALTKHVRRFMVPALKNQGAHRAQCHSIEGHEDAHRWLKLLGAHTEPMIRGFGRGRENFIPFVWEA